jgi:molecular chaperone GrpE
MHEDREFPAKAAGSNEEIEIEFLDQESQRASDAEEEQETEMAVSQTSVEDEAAVLKAELDHVRDIYLRKLAEFDNFRKRIERERDEYRRSGVEEMIRELLPVVDNFERALKHAQDDTGAFLQGIQMIAKQLTDTLERRGVTELNPIGEPFNPELHEAVQRVEDTDYPPGTVAWVMLKGYVVGDRLIRPAMVGVSVEPAVGESNGGGAP